MIRRAAFVLASALAACAGTRSVAPATSEIRSSGPPAAPAPGDLTDVVASLRAPARIVYDPQALGAADRFVSIRLENAGDRPVSLAHVHATFTATRDGVGFPCNAHVSGEGARAEPAYLLPGQATTLERLIDCAMPLPGRYDVRVWIHSDRAEGGGPPCGLFVGSYTEEEDCRPGAGVFVGSFHVDVVTSGRGPRPVASREGLFALVAASSATRPIPAEAWAEGRYRIALVLVNGSARALDVGRMHLSLLVFKEGSATPPCAEGARVLDDPSALAAGEVHVLLVPVTCAPTEEGRYRIVASLGVEDGEQSEIGEVLLLVTKNPYLLFEPLGAAPAAASPAPR